MKVVVNVNLNRKRMRCPVGHNDIWRKGLVPSRQGPKTRYICRTCGRSFYPQNKNKRYEAVEEKVETVPVPRSVVESTLRLLEEDKVKAGVEEEKPEA